MVKYSIIIPVYNMEHYLKECLTSICNQICDSMEIIIVNDGSTDNSLLICKEFKKLDPRIIIVNQENCGVSIARNEGIKIATGEWIIFLDADDYIKSDTIKKMNDYIDVYKDSDIIIFCNSILEIHTLDVKENLSELLSSILKCPNINTKKYEYMYSPGILNKIFKRKTVLDKNIFFDSELIIGEDMLFNIEFSSVSNRITFINYEYYIYRKNNLSACNRVNCLVPESDYKFQMKLQDFATNHNELDLSRAVIRAAIGGIVLSCNLCFFKYRLHEYKLYKNKLKSYISKSIYVDALKYKNKFNLGIKTSQIVLLYLLRIKVYFLPFAFRKFQEVITNKYK